MRFKTDENLPTEVRDLLHASGHDAVSVVDQELAGHPDTEVASICRAEQRVLVTLDLDFSDIRAYPPQDHCGIIVLRPGSQTIEATVRLTQRALLLLAARSVVGTLWIVEEHRVRVRAAMQADRG